MLETLFPLMGLFFPALSHCLLGERPFLTGYAVTAGSFSRPFTTDVVGGAPQDEGIGKVRSKVWNSMESDTRGEHAAPGIEVCHLFDVNILLGGWQVNEAMRSLPSASF